MARTYSLQARPVADLDRDALLRALGKLDLSSLSQRWRGCLVVRSAIQDAAGAPGVDESWLWAYGLHMALQGSEEPLDVGSSSPIMEGYRAGAALLPAGAPLVLGWSMVPPADSLALTASRLRAANPGLWPS